MLRYPIWRSEITPGRENCIIVIGGDAHDMSPESSKDSSLLWLCVYVRPHLLFWTMFDGYLLSIDLVLNKKILHLNVLSPLRTACPPVGLEQDSNHVVLVEQGMSYPCSIIK